MFKKLGKKTDKQSLILLKWKKKKMNKIQKLKKLIKKKHKYNFN